MRRSKDAQGPVNFFIVPRKNSSPQIGRLALLLSQPTLDAVWQMFASWPLVLQALVGLLLLPVVAGLWIWETSWPVIVRLALVTGLAWVTIYTFFPKRTPSQPANPIKSN